MKTILFADFIRFNYCNSVDEFCARTLECIDDDEAARAQADFARRHGLETVSVEVEYDEARCFAYYFRAANGDACAYQATENIFDENAWDADAPKFLRF